MHPPSALLPALPGDNEKGVVGVGGVGVERCGPAAPSTALASAMASRLRALDASALGICAMHDSMASEYGALASAVLAHAPDALKCAPAASKGSKNQSGVTGMRDRAAAAAAPAALPCAACSRGHYRRTHRGGGRRSQGQEDAGTDYATLAHALKKAKKKMNQRAK